MRLELEVAIWIEAGSGKLEKRGFTFIVKRKVTGLWGRKRVGCFAPAKFRIFGEHRGLLALAHGLRL